MIKKDILEIEWEINNDCNFNCLYCCTSGHRQDPKFQAKLLDYNKIIESFYAIAASVRIRITGGEPFLYPNFVKLCRGLTEKHTLMINTNISSPLIKEFCQQVNPARVEMMQCSVHYTEVKRLNLMDTVISNIKLIKEQGFPYFVLMVLWPPLLKDFPDIYNFFLEHDIRIIARPFKGLYNNKLYPLAYSLEEKALISKYQAQAEAKKLTTRAHLDRDYSFMAFSVDSYNYSYHGNYCRAGKDFVVVAPNGNIGRCYDEKYQLGNIFEQTFTPLSKAVKCHKPNCVCGAAGLNYTIGNPHCLSDIVVDSSYRKRHKKGPLRVFLKKNLPIQFINIYKKYKKAFE